MQTKFLENGRSLFVMAIRNENDNIKKIKNVFICFGIIVILAFLVMTYKDDKLRLNASFVATDDNATGIENDEYFSTISESAEEGDALYAHLYSYKPGKYNVKFHCEVSNKGSGFSIVTDGSVTPDNTFKTEVLDYIPLLPDVTEYDYDYTIPSHVRDVKMVIHYGGSGTLKIGRAYHTSYKLYYYDCAFVLFCLALLGLIIGYQFRKKKWEFKIFDSEKESGLTDFGRIFFLLVITFIASIPLLGKGFYERADLQFHLMRIQGISQALSSGQFPVRMQPVWHYGIGYPLSIFYPDLVLYPAAIMVALGLSEYYALCVLLIINNFLTAHIGYKAFSAITKSDKKGLIISAIYTLSVFRFGVMYQCQYGSIMAMIFFPLVLDGIVNVIWEDRTRWHILALGMTGIISSHILSSVMATLMCILCCIVGLRNLASVKKLLAIGKAVLTTLLLNLWFIVPFLLSYNRNYNIIFEQPITNRSVVFIPQMFQWINFGGMTNQYGSETAGEMPISVGILFAIAIIGFLVMVIQERKCDYVLGTCVFISLATLWLSSEFFPWNYIIRVPVLGKMLYHVQFAWRYELIATVGLSVVTAEVILYFLEKLDLKIYFAVMVICLINIAPSIDCVTNYYPMFFQDKYQYSYHFVDDTENVDYMYRDLPYEELKALPRTVIAENANVSNLKRNGVDMSFDYTKDGDAKFTLPIIDYPGYRAWINGEEEELSSTDKHQLTIIADRLKTNSGSIEIKYREPMLWRVCEIISVVSAMIMMIYVRKRKRVE